MSVLVERWDKRRTVIIFHPSCRCKPLGWQTLQDIFRLAYHNICFDFRDSQCGWITARQTMLIRPSEALPSAIALQTTVFNIDRC
jgi:hypothetical protein